MKITKVILTILLFAGISFTSINAQITLQVGGGLGYVMSGGEYKGSTTGFSFAR